MTTPPATYALEFTVEALQEWRALDGSVRAQLKKALLKRLGNPHVKASALRGDLAAHYKIKLKALGYRLVYRVEDGRLVVVVIAVGRRENDEVYRLAATRGKQP
ncbi:MAG: type II toxin-antitoxin system RelE family toxin [Inhella sp.]|uniref:type II toxin-antitoxin system RelE family toxin n=1 Tax=Inhella sp. TaxID=1921806 RepID=UPI0022C8A0B0|nr:type II toxin-antitoxin system RelE/ParE family toxin [Inhella sp.]MCZ8236594.1 type II toxin-antitoxin system RelE/ParE family toxin [Inhella sp.]